jgi:hypothetical protein
MRVACLTASQRTSISGNRRLRVGRFGGAGRPFGVGAPASSSCEDAWPPPTTLPTTTIAWRVIHLAAWTDIYRQFAFSDTRPDLNDLDVPGELLAGLAWLYSAQDEFLDGVDGLSAESAFEPRPAHWGESVPVVRLITTMLTEHVHHLAEIGVLRDLRRGHALSQPPRRPIPAPSWWSATQPTGA